VSPPAVEVVDLVKRYGGRTAVDRLSLIVPAGSVTAILGPNGAGKTTTVEICEGFRTSDRGTVRVLGLEPRDRSLRFRVGVMLQGGGIAAAARPAEILRQYADFHAHPHDPQTLLDLLGLDAVATTPYRRLSGGQQQRLSLALAILGRPELVFLDEPTAGLDPQGRVTTWRLIEELRRDGVSVVLTTHLMEDAEHLADQVVILDCGRVVAAGPPAALTGSERQESWRVRGPPGLPLAALLAAVPEATSVAEERPGAYVVAGEVTPPVLATLTAWCSGHGFLPEGLAVGRRSLEDVFLELTGRELRP
jgi:ABC-2 type transport system ATP-binding protein